MGEQGRSADQGAAARAAEFYHAGIRVSGKKSQIRRGPFGARWGPDARGRGCSEFASELAALEKEYHLLNAQMTMSEQRLAQVQKEEKLQRQKSANSLQSEYNARIQNLEKESRELRAEQRTIKETYEERARQKYAFFKLEKMIEMKLKVSAGYAG